jgi:hypothetical protein
VNRALLLRVLEVRVTDMLRYLDAGCPVEYVEMREEVERICARLDEEDDVRTILEFLKSL